MILRISLYEIRIACSDLYHSPFRTWIHLKIYPNTDKYLRNLMVKFQLDPMVGFEVMLNSVKLNGRKSYAKIRIWPCLGRITRLNRITLCHTPIRPFLVFWDQISILIVGCVTTWSWGLHQYLGRWIPTKSYLS